MPSTSINELSIEVDRDRINDNLHLVKQGPNTPSESYFKFTVYALRFAYRIEGMKDKRIGLPPIKHSNKLPIVLSREEVRRLHKASQTGPPGAVFPPGTPRF